ncbi:uncharacterized protein LOC111716786 [Eurytemora carolleeae]|uniref:uncharacterized protein LOC111716786 n=1 Tax=Eurytemora carolleeae TaxID=1294199 RepID=UPI000C7822B2|nr:uncharacterized protein LOC111716786 [Eurytemora carolleeae]|eukprot:XP_023348038.1 uncharacterized protein LOC111716786 [Eurytemora affinis]
MFNANILPWGPFPPRLPQPRPRPLKVFTPGTEIKCKVVSVVSPNRICVIPEEFISEEINLTTRIIEEVRREGVVLKELKVGIKCLARNSSMSFCRGVLLEVGEDRCKVYYIDLGSIELCHNQEIFKYSHIFEDIPCLMVPVHLATIYPAGGPCWSATAIDKLKDAVIEHYSMFNVQVLDRPVSGSVAGVSVSSVPVQLIHRDYKLDIFDSEAELKEKTFNLAESLVSDGLAIRYSSQDNNKSRDNFLLRLQNLREKEKQYFQSVHYRMKSTTVSLYKVLENNFTWKKASLPLSSEFKCILTGLNKDGLYLQSFEEQSHNMSSINSGLNLRYGSSIPQKY